MRTQTTLWSALAISISAVSPAAADPAELPEGAPIDGVRLSGLRDVAGRDQQGPATAGDQLPGHEERWLALLRSPRLDHLDAGAVADDIRALWRTGQFAAVACRVEGRELVFEVARRRGPREAEAPPAGAPIVAIRFDGNSAIGDGALRRHLRSRERGDRWRDELWRDELRLRAIYRERGYLDAVIRRPDIGADDRGTHVRFAIDEGRRYRIGAVDQRAGESLESGAHYSHAAIAAAASAIAERLGRRGHAFASVRPVLSVDRDAALVDVSFAVEPGPVAQVAAVIIRGNKKTADRVIRREIEIAAGDPFDAAAVARSRARVAALGFFESVEVETSRGASPREAVVTFTVAERATGSFQIGAGFSSVESAVASARVEQANLFGTGQSLGLAARISSVRQNAALRWSDPHLANTDWRGGLELYNDQRLWDGFVRESLGGAITVGRSIGPRWSASLTYRLEEVGAQPARSLWTEAFGAEVDRVGPELAHRGRVSSLRATLVRDTRDDRLRPRRGTVAGGFVEIAAPAIGSEVDLFRAGGWVRHHRPVVGPVGLHAGAEIGLVSTRDPAGVPLAHRYQLGGIGSVRGYAPGSLGPRLSLGGDPDAVLDEIGLGGNLMATASIELTAPLIESLGIGGVVFADAGQVFNLDRRYCASAGCPLSAAELLRGLRASVGFGLRWDSPLGPLRFEWGFPLFRRPGDAWVRFHFGVGLGL